MTIKYLSASQGSGFVGFRISGVYAGKEREIEFSTAPAKNQDESDPYFRYQYLKAKLQLTEWESEHALFQYQVFVSESDPQSGPFEGTGCHGIFCHFFHSKLAGWQPGFKVRASRRGRSPRFLFATKGFSRAWRDAVGFWSAEHRIEREDAERVLERPPQPSQFKELRRYLNDNKKADIPVEALSPVFAEQREKVAQKKALERAQSMKLTEGLSAQSKTDLETEMLSWFEAETES